jgi:hypothetical protein
MKGGVVQRAFVSNISENCVPTPFFLTHPYIPEHWHDNLTTCTPQDDSIICIWGKARQNCGLSPIICLSIMLKGPSFAPLATISASGPLAGLGRFRSYHCHVFFHSDGE